MYEQDMITALGCTCIFMASKILVVLTSIHIIIMRIRIQPKNKFILQNSRISNKNMLKKKSYCHPRKYLFCVNGGMTIVLSSHQPLIFNFVFLSTRYVFSVYLAVL